MSVDICYGDVKHAMNNLAIAYFDVPSDILEAEFESKNPCLIKHKTGKYRHLPLYYAMRNCESLISVLRRSNIQSYSIEQIHQFLNCELDLSDEAISCLAQHFDCSREEIIETFEPPAVRGIGADWVGNFGSVMQDYIDPDYDDGIMSMAINELRDGAIQASFRALYSTEIEPGEDLGQRIAEEEAKLY